MITMNLSDLPSHPIEVSTLVYQALFGSMFWLIPISVIGGALWFQKRDPIMVTMYFIMTFAIFSSGNFFVGNAEVAVFYIVLMAAGITALIAGVFLMKK